MKRLALTAALVAALAAPVALTLPGCSPKQQLTAQETIEQARQAGRDAIDALRIAVGQSYETTGALLVAEKINVAQAADVRARLVKVEGYLDQAEEALNLGVSFAPILTNAVEAFTEATRLTKGVQS